MSSRRSLWLGLLLVLCLADGWHRWNLRTLHQPPGVLVAEEPLQEDYKPLPSAFDHEGYLIQPLAAFGLEARVLSREDYRWDSMAGLIPTDLALGWGRMSDTAVLDQLEIEQGDRFYSWSATVFPIPRREIETHSANMHLIPANREVGRMLKRVRPGSVIRLEGELVEVRAPKGWSIRSSMTREDTGAGACEVVWVKSLELR
jgi:hypothetical protein